MAATTGTLPRFFKVFISSVSSDSMLIPVSYYDELPRRLPRTSILNGTSGCSWNVTMKQKQNEVYFGQGWSEFVKDNSLSDGDFLTFAYDGHRVFEVSIFGSDACKQHKAVNTEVEEDDDKEDSVCSLSTENSDTSSELAIANTIPRIKNKGKKKVIVVEDSDEDYDIDNCIESSRAVRIRGKAVKPKIKNPEAYLDNPKNICFETNLKNRTYELCIRGQLVKDYSLKFQDKVYYIDNHKDGKLLGKLRIWKDKRVTINKWNSICTRNKLKKEDGILCELFREHGLVYAVKIHIIRGKDL